MIGLGHWDFHKCDKREARNNDQTIQIFKVISKPQEGWPNMGQFQINLTSGSQGFHINYCPYCGYDLRLKEEKE